MAPGSHAVFGGWEARDCAVCGERVTIKRSGLWMRRLGGEPVSLHHECASAWFREAIA